MPIPPRNGEDPPTPMIAVTKIAGPLVMESVHGNCSDPGTPRSQAKSVRTIRQIVRGYFGPIRSYSKPDKGVRAREEIEKLKNIRPEVDGPQLKRSCTWSGIVVSRLVINSIETVEMTSAVSTLPSFKIFR